MSNGQSSFRAAAGAGILAHVVTDDGVVHDLETMIGERAMMVRTACGRTVALRPSGWRRPDVMDGVQIAREAADPSVMCRGCVRTAQESAHRTVPCRNLTTADDVAPGEYRGGALLAYSGTHADLRGLVRENRYADCARCEYMPADGICVAARTREGWVVLHRVQWQHVRRA